VDEGTTIAASRHAHRRAWTLLTSAAAADMAAAAHLDVASEARPKAACPEQQSEAVRVKWGREDSNLRRQSQRVYSPSPLAAREHPQGSGDWSAGANPRLTPGRAYASYLQNRFTGVLPSQR